jgi:hypothetical protein
MSTYMEAFPAGSAQHPMQPTPPPMGQMSGPYAVGAPSGGYAQPMAPTPSAGMPLATPAAGASGLYAPSGSTLAPKKSKVGVIVAIVAVLAVGGGIAAFVLLQKGDGQSAGGGSGSAIAQTGSSGSQAVTPPDHGSGTTVAAAGSGSAVAAGSAGSAVEAAGSGSAGSAGPAENIVKVTTVPFVDEFTVVAEDGSKIDDGNAPAEVPVPIDGTRTIIIKAKGYKDKKTTIAGRKPEIMVKIEPLQKAGHVNPPPHPPTPGHPDCSAKVLDPNDARCRSEYCSHHPDDMNCQLQ